MDNATANGFFIGLHFADPDTGFVVGESRPVGHAYEGMLYKTDDGGAHWYHHTVSNVSNSGSTALTSIVRPAPRLLYVGGLAGAGNEKTFFRSTDDGSTWTVSNFYTSILSLAFTSPTTGFAGTYGGLLRTGDGGLTWGSIGGVTGQVNSIRFLGDHGFAVTGSGGIFETTDGGASWAGLTSPVQGTASLNNVFLHPSGIAYAVGSSGTVLRYQGAADVASGAPAATLHLGQNQPNPFRGSTRLGFRLPRDSEASLQLYDAEGRVLRVLANGIYSAGDHEVVLDGRSLPAGTYFYRLRAGDLVETRKLTVQR
jgi:photosystem II stability/assembly factor-like uncharacterized protein